MCGRRWITSKRTSRSSATLSHLRKRFTDELKFECIPELWSTLKVRAILQELSNKLLPHIKIWTFFGAQIAFNERYYSKAWIMLNCKVSEDYGGAFCQNSLWELDNIVCSQQDCIANISFAFGITYIQCDKSKFDTHGLHFQQCFWHTY